MNRTARDTALASVLLGRLQSPDWDFFGDATTDYLKHGLHPYPVKVIPQPLAISLWVRPASWRSRKISSM